MPPKIKSKSFPPVRVSEELHKLTIELANKSDEYLSDYIRKAVETRNKLERRKPNG